MDIDSSTVVRKQTAPPIQQFRTPYFQGRQMKKRTFDNPGSSRAPYKVQRINHIPDSDIDDILSEPDELFDSSVDAILDNEVHFLG